MNDRCADDLDALSRLGTLDAIIVHHARTTPDAIATRFEGQSTSYKTLAARAAALADRLVAEGVKPGDRIGYIGKSNDRYFVLLYAVASAGAVLVPLNWRLAEEEWRFIVSDSGMVRLFSDAEFMERAVRLAAEASFPAPEEIPSIEGSATRICGHVAKTDDSVLQIYTSGTTGRPKGAMLTHRNLLALRAPGYAAGLAWFPRCEDRSLVILPVAHIAGTAYALFAFYSGGCVIIAREFDAGIALELIETEKVTHMLLAPAALQLMLEHPDRARRDLSSFRYLTYGASPISQTLMDRASEALSCAFVQMYGMTEAAGGVVALTPEDHRSGDRERLRSAGRAMPGVEIAIAGKDGGHAPVGETGEILVRCSAVMAGYWGQPAATAEAIDADGWLRSGDIGRMDADGYVYVLDRAKDMIISGGENIYPAEIENVLFAHPDIADVAVFGVPSDRWGEVPAAVLVLRPGAVLDAEAIQQWCGNKLARFKIPKIFIEETVLPRNAGNKVLKRELRKQYAARQTGPLIGTG